MQAERLEPSWAPIPHSTRGKVVEDILHDRARPGGMEGAESWPDDSRVLAARDRLSRIFRFYCGWPNDLFLPHDSFDAIHSNWSRDGFDTAEVTMEIEDLFDIEWPEADAEFRNLTYLEFIEHFSGKLPNCFEKYDAEALRPFALPDGYHARGWWNSVKRFIILDRHYAWWFRGRQAARSGPWRNLWPDNPDIASAREKVSTILVEELGWFDDAFVPDDSAAALFLPGKGRKGGGVRAVQRLNHAFPGSRLAAEEVKRSDEAFIALLQRLIGITGQA